MEHRAVICQKFMNMPVQTSNNPEACKALSSRQTHPILAHLVSCQPQTSEHALFPFSIHLFNSTILVLKSSIPKPNLLFVMSSRSPVCSELLAKTKPNQNAAMQSIMNHVFQMCCHRGISKSSVCHAVARTKYAISKDVYIQAAQEGKEGIEHLLFGR